MNYLVEHYKNKSIQLEKELNLLKEAIELLESSNYNKFLLLNEIVRQQGPPPTWWEALASRLRANKRVQGLADEALAPATGRGQTIIPTKNIFGQEFSRQSGGWPILYRERYWYYNSQNGKVYRWNPETGQFAPYEGKNSPWGKVVNGKPTDVPKGQTPSNADRPGGKGGFAPTGVGVAGGAAGGGGVLIGGEYYQPDDSIRPGQGWVSPGEMMPMPMQENFMFNDNLNFSNNLYDNLQIRRAFQKKLLKESETRTSPMGDSETRNFINSPSGMAGGAGGEWRGFGLGPNDNPWQGTAYETQGQTEMSTRGALGPGRGSPYNANDPFWSTQTGSYAFNTINFIIENWNNPKALMQRFGAQAGNPDGRLRLTGSMTRYMAMNPNVAWPPQLHQLVQMTHDLYNT